MSDRTLTTRAHPSRRTATAALASLVVAATAWIGFPASAASSTGASAARPPEPSPLPIRWEFDLRIGPMRLASVRSNDGETRPYFYLTYSVTNRTGEDRPFTPTWVLTTDTGQTYRSGRGVPTEVTKQILADLDNPFLEDQISILGRLQQGRVNAKEGLIVWPAPDLSIDELRVYAGGFSGESTRITTVDPETGEEKEFVLRKTRMVRYPVPGNLVRSVGKEIRPAEFRWIMR